MSIKTEEPKHPRELLSAIESTLQHHSLRLKPGEDAATVADAFEKRGIKLTAQNGYLSATQTVAGFEQAMHVNECVEGLATQEPARFFPRTVDGIESRDQLDREGKLKFIREKGLGAWESLPQSAPKQTAVVLDQTRLTRVQWLSLDRATRAKLSGQWGALAVGKIMGRSK